MNFFSISDLASFSGIQAHTIRMWERRYAALTPHRSEGNTRYYDGNQLRRLLNIVSLHDRYKLPELCALKDKELFNLVHNNLNTSTSSDSEYYLNQLVAAGIEFDEAQFDKLLNHCLLAFGVHGTYTRIIYPLINRTGMMWSCNQISPAHEHFISALLIQKLHVVINSLPAPEANAQTWLLFLPEDEFHELGLLFANYMLRQAGHKVIYLGCNLPLDGLRETVKMTGVKNLLLFMVRKKPVDQTDAYIHAVKQIVSKGQLVVCGAAAHTGTHKSRAGLSFVHSWNDFISTLAVNNPS